MKGLIRDILIAVVIVVAITMVIKPTIVKESSMQPTLYENNYLLLNKQAYRFGEEKRGDIIAVSYTHLFAGHFHRPEDYQQKSAFHSGNGDRDL